MRYPKECFSAREDVTREKTKEYDKKKELVYKKCEELNHDYYHLPFRERIEIYKQAQEILGIKL
jgi:hypothetical protein